MQRLLARIGFFPLLALAALLPAIPGSTTAGPGALLSTHRALFRAMDAGDVEQALAFLAPDEGLDRELSARPCTLFLEDGGEARAGHDQAASRDLLAAWIRADAEAAGRWRTEIELARTDCVSEDLGYAVLEFRRTLEQPDGASRVRRYRSTSLGAWRRGRWLLYHWQITAVD